MEPQHPALTELVRIPVTDHTGNVVVPRTKLHHLTGLTEVESVPGPRQILHPQGASLWRYHMTSWQTREAIGCKHGR